MRAQPLSVIQPEHRAALIVRVSTDMQAMNDEGSLATQLQRLREHLRYKAEALGEDWSEAGVYELRGVSGKDSIRSKEFERLFADIRTGQVNTVVVTALERICRSIADFLKFFEVLNEYGVEFVCLKQQYDTTTPQGRLFVHIMMALAQFEREQTAERTRDATEARARRGLWNGGWLLGYDLDPEHKGYPVPNADEAAVVNYAFDTYLELGSLKGTRDAINRRGYRTKAFTSRRKVARPGHEFSLNNVQSLLKNPAYIGLKVIDAKGSRETVPAVWEGIVDPQKFERVQQLMKLNGRTNHSQAKKTRHVHILTGGVLECGQCGAPMVGRSGTGRQGRTYFYYCCPDKGCALRVVAPEVEEAVVSTIGLLSADAATVAVLTERANAMLRKQKPEIEKRLRELRRRQQRLAGEAGTLVKGLGRADAAAARVLNQQLVEVGQRRQETESAIVEAERDLRQINEAAITPDAVRAGLHEFNRAFQYLRPFEQRELIRLVIKRAILTEKDLTLEVYGGAVGSFADASSHTKKANPDGRGFAQLPSWLPDVDSNHEHRG